jgi:hypothetical protein
MARSSGYRFYQYSKVSPRGSSRWFETLRLTSPGLPAPVRATGRPSREVDLSSLRALLDPLCKGHRAIHCSAVPCTANEGKTRTGTNALQDTFTHRARLRLRQCKVRWRGRCVGAYPSQLPNLLWLSKIQFGDIGATKEGLSEGIGQEQGRARPLDGRHR